ncbi:MAG: NAD(P)-dependent oxidoreductase [Chloroflexi bacterium]|nr:NAD(P)-dependent oxidoreductase [Chloroflexota bacterium]
MRILVTGGAGYVGCVLVPLLLAAGHRVVVLDSLRKGGLGLLPWAGHPRLETVVGDVRDAEAVRGALKDADAIMHLAAIVGYPACQKDPWLARTTNLDGTENLIRQRSPQQPIIYPSSLSNYGTVVDQVCTEEMEPKPITLYGVTKQEAEKRLLEAGNAVVFRPATVFGLSPQMRLDLLFNEFVYKALRDRHLVVYQPNFVRAFIHVRDFARAFLFALDHLEEMRGQVYNLGADSLNLTKGELAKRIRRRLDFVLRISNNGEDPDKRNYRVDFSKLTRLGFSVETGIDEGIDELVRGLPLIEVDNPFSNVAYT